jgi:hypothetical protein
MMVPERKILSFKNWRGGKKILCFIVAQGRDGSTLLQALLNSSEHCRIHGENILVPSLASAVGAFHNGLPKSLKQRSVAKRSRLGKEHPWFGVGSIRLDVITRAIKRIILKRILPQARSYRVIGCKEIRWAVFPQSLAGMRILFPEAKYIFLSRSSQEMSESGWWPNVPDAEEIIESRASFLRNESELFRHSLWVDYADLINGDESRNQVSAFLGIELSADDWRKTQSIKLDHGAERAPWVGFSNEFSAQYQQGSL